MFIHREGQTQNSIARFFLRNVGVDSGIRKSRALFGHPFVAFPRYPELYKLAMNHDGSQESDPPPFAELENDLVTSAMVGGWTSGRT